MSGIATKIPRGGAWSRWCFLLAVSLALSCSDDGPAGPDTSNLEVLGVQGNGQGAAPGSTLPAPFEVRVQTAGNGSPVDDARVRWEILEGAGGTLESSVSRTDSLGLASVRFTLGSELGRYRVRGSVRGALVPAADFTAEAVLQPVVTGVPQDPVRAGTTFRIQGENFSAIAARNVVTFSGVRSRVLSSTSQELQVEAPGCLLARDYELRVQVGSLSADPTSVGVQGPPEAMFMDPAEDRVLDPASGQGCVFLPESPGSAYLVVPHSTSTVSGVEYPFNLVTLTVDGGFPFETGAPVSAVPGPPSEVSRPVQRVRSSDRFLVAQERWDEHLRKLESSLVEGYHRAPAGEDPRHQEPETVSAPPRIGEEKTFKVLNREQRFEKVRAQVRYVSEEVVVYLDQDVPSGGFSDRELADLAEEFDQVIHPVVTETFGEESDIDDNQRIIILFTSAVNRLTGSDSDGYVGGFFFGLDLLEGSSGSNGGEIFYAMVPDPNGEEGPSIGKYLVLKTIPAILAHEFQHMVHFHQRMILRGAETTEALWLSEALAQMAEDQVGIWFQERGNGIRARQYQSGNWARAQRFLEETSQVSVLASLSPGTLAERGAGWLFLKHVYGLEGQSTLLAELVSSTDSGVENLTRAADRTWPELISNWSGSLFLDGTGLPVRRDLEVGGVDLRVALADEGGVYPLRAMEMGGRTGSFSGTLWSSAPEYFIIRPPEGGVTLSVGGPLGVQPENWFGLRTLVVRMQ